MFFRDRLILLLLAGGLALSLTNRPDTYFRIVKKIANEWEKINKRTLRNVIKKLYQSKLVDYKEDDSGAVTLVLTENGKRKR